MTQLSTHARNLTWLVDSFVRDTPGARHAVVVAADGLPIVADSSLDRAAADRLAAVASGLVGLAWGTAGRFGGGAVQNIIIEMERAWLFVTGISEGSSLCVHADADVDVGRIAYEMAVFAQRAAEHLTPETRLELQTTLVR